MDDTIEELIKICKYRDDPTWPTMSKLFEDVTWPEINKVLKNRDRIVSSLIKNTSARIVKDKTINIEDCIEIDQKWIITKKPVIFLGGYHFPENEVHIRASRVYLGLWHHVL